MDHSTQMGLLVPVALSIWIFVAKWTFGGGNAWVYILRLTWMLALPYFVFRWTQAPNRADKHKETVVASMMVRSTALLYYFSVGTTLKDFWSILFAFFLTWSITGLFEEAYDRAVPRQTPQGIGEYEALEGPSVGL